MSTKHNWFEIAFYKTIISKMYKSLLDYQNFLDSPHHGLDAQERDEEHKKVSAFISELDGIDDKNNLDPFVEYMRGIVPDITNFDDANPIKMGLKILDEQLASRGISARPGTASEHAKTFLGLLDGLLGGLNGMPGVSVGVVGPDGVPTSFEDFMKNNGHCEECPDKETCPDYDKENCTTTAKEFNSNNGNGHVIEMKKDPFQGSLEDIDETGPAS